MTVTTNSWGYCPCGHLWLQHDVDEYRGDGSETCCVGGCDQGGCPGKVRAGFVVGPEGDGPLALDGPGGPSFDLEAMTAQAVADAARHWRVRPDEIVVIPPRPSSAILDAVELSWEALGAPMWLGAEIVGHAAWVEQVGRGCWVKRRRSRRV